MAPHDPVSSGCSARSTSVGSDVTTGRSSNPGPLRVGSPHTMRTMSRPTGPATWLEANSVTDSPARIDSGSQ